MTYIPPAFLADGPDRKDCTLGMEPGTAAVKRFRSIARTVPWLILMILADPARASANVAIRRHALIIAGIVVGSSEMWCGKPNRERRTKGEFWYSTA